MNSSRSWTVPRKDIFKFSMIPRHCDGAYIWNLTMMTSSNRNIFRVTGPLCGEFTGPRWIPHTKASDAELWCFSLVYARINGWVNNGETGDLGRHRTHYDAIVMRWKTNTWQNGYHRCWRQKTHWNSSYDGNLGPYEIWDIRPNIILFKFKFAYELFFADAQSFWNFPWNISAS